MSESEQELDQVQRWMQAVISHPLGIAAGIKSDQAQGELDIDLQTIENVVDRSAALSGLERLAIYGNAYYARLLECLRISYPMLCHALGSSLFDQFSLQYLQSYPSKSYTLEHLGAHFRQFLEETRPAGITDDDIADDDTGKQDASDEKAAITKSSGVGWPELLVDLTHLEWTIGEVFSAPGVEGETLLEADDLAALAPERWAEARLVPVVCLRLLEFRFDICSYYTQMRHSEEHDSEKPDVPAPETTYLAISRRNYIVRRFPLSRPEYFILRALQSGANIGDAIAAGAEQSDLSDQQFAECLHGWFAAWTRQKFFHRIELSSTVSDTLE